MSNIGKQLVEKVLKGNPLQNETFHFLKDSQIFCQVNNFQEEHSGYFFISNQRLGYVLNDGECFYYFPYSTVYRYESQYTDETEQYVYISILTIHDNQWKWTRFHVLVDDKVFSSIQFVLDYKYFYPAETSKGDIKKIASLINESRFQDAIDVLNELGQNDPLCGIYHALRFQVNSIQGKSEFAQFNLIQMFDTLSILDPEPLIYAIDSLEWDSRIIQWMNQYQENTLEFRIKEYMMAKSRKNPVEIFHAMNQMFAQLEGEYSDFGDILSLKSSLLINYFVGWSHLLDENMVKRTHQLIVDTEKKYIQSNDFAHLSDAEANMVVRRGATLNSYPQSGLFECVRTMYSTINGYPQISEMFNHHQFVSLANHSFDLVSLYDVDQSDTCSFLYNELPAKEKSRLINNIYCLFALLRTEGITEKTKQVFNSMRTKEGIDINIVLSKPQLILETSIYFFSCIEYFILTSQKKLANEYILHYRFKYGEALGSNIHHILKFGKDILDVYEAWANSDIPLLMSAKNFEVFLEIDWLPSLYIKYIQPMIEKHLKRLNENPQQSMHVVRNSILEITSGFQSLAQSNELLQAKKTKINEYVNQIKNRLHSDELRIAVIGETSAGKTSLLNRMFATDLFYVTQEEATGVPTEIRNGIEADAQVLDRHGNVVIRLNDTQKFELNQMIKRTVSNSNDTSLNSQLHAFIKQHTKVDEERSVNVDRVVVTLPIHDLPKNVVIIDTPGFNANQKRSDIALNVINQAHVCIFIIDARNALKSKEMNILRTVREQTGKLFLVLNKMDLIMGDDELDCDDGDSIKQTLDRVNGDLVRFFDSDKFQVCPVTCMPADRVPAEIVEYVNNLSSLKTRVIEHATTNELELITDMAVKESVDLIEEVQTIMYQTNTQKINKTYESIDKLPMDPHIHASFLYEQINDWLFSLEQSYKSKMYAFNLAKIQDAIDTFAAWVSNQTSSDHLTTGAQAKAESILTIAVNEINRNRKQELNKFLTALSKNIGDYFVELYKGYDIKIQVNKTEIDNLLEKIQRVTSTEVSAIGNIDDGVKDQLSGAAIGAAIGLILGPLGALVGGFLGGLFFSKSIEEIQYEVNQAFYNVANDTHMKSNQMVENEISLQNDQTIMAKIDEVCESIMTKYIQAVDRVRGSYRNEINESLERIIQTKHHITDIANKNVLLETWRSSRR